MNYIINFRINILLVKLSNSSFNKQIFLPNFKVRKNTQFIIKRLIEWINTGIGMYPTTML